MKKVIICGLGAVGLTFGTKLNKCKEIDLKVLVDKVRLEKYAKNRPIFNGEEQAFQYILPEQAKETADLIIIATKFTGLESAISYIKGFVGGNTKIISLINGISSEEIISAVYPDAKVLKSYFIGHSAVRVDNKVTQDGIGEIVFEGDETVEKIFKLSGINYSIPENIDYSMWLKYSLNILCNQVSAILKMTFGEMKSNKEFTIIAKKIIAEVRKIAESKGVKHCEHLEEDAFCALNRMCDDGKTSMLQDILAKRPTEVEIFAGEIIRLGEKNGIDTPYNRVLYDLIKIEEERI